MRLIGLLVGAVIAAAVAAAPVVVAEPPGAPGIRQVELTVPTADGLELPATLRIPLDAAPGAPAMVLVHGAGAGSRDKYAEEADAFARAGVITLAYDKRTVGYSLTERSYSQLADDAVAAAGVLRAQPGVDPGAVGLWGISEGGWVAPLAASRAPETAFLVVVGANGVAPLRQQTWAEGLKMQAAGVRGSLVDAASTGTYRLFDSMGMFPEAYYDPIPVLSGLSLPVLGVWGAFDRATPPVESVAAFRDALDRAGNTHYTLRTVEDAEHSLHTTVDGFARGPDLAPGYAELIGTWTSAAAAGSAPSTSVTGTGDQPRRTVEVVPSAWWESAPAHGVALGLMLGGFGGFALVAAIRRLFSRSEAAPTAARVLAGAGLVSVLGTLTYLGVLAFVRGGRTIDPGPLLAGRTLPWLGLQALAVITVVAAALLVVGLLRGRPTGGGTAAGSVRVLEPAGGGPGTVRRPAVTRRSGGERVRLAMLLVAAAVHVPWALYWGLFVP